MKEAGGSVPPLIWAAAFQVYWLLAGVVLMLLGITAAVGSAGTLGLAGALSNGFGAGGAQVERLLLVGLLAFLVGVIDTCLSVVLVYGFLTLKKWTYGVFMVWLPVMIILTVLAYAVKPSVGDTGPSTTPFVVIFTFGLLGLLNIAALVVEFLLVKQSRSNPAEA